MLDKEYQFFLANREELVKKYTNKYIVIRGEEVVGVYDSELKAYIESKNKYELGTFFIQLCTINDHELTQTFNSRVTF